MIKVPVILEPLPAAPPIIFPVTVGVDQVYVVPAGTIVAEVGVLLTGVSVKATPLHVVIDCVGITGVGFTVIVTVKGVPAHPLADGVTEQVAVFTVFVVFVNVPVMLEPALATPPVIPDPDGAPQL